MLNKVNVNTYTSLFSRRSIQTCFGEASQRPSLPKTSKAGYTKPTYSTYLFLLTYLYQLYQTDYTTVKKKI